MAHKFLSLDRFALRQFDASFSGGTKISISPQEFMSQLAKLNIGEADLKDGYAPFCKHVFVPNFAQCETTVLAITSDNEHLLKTGYERRTEKELPVLARWFPKESVKTLIRPSKFLDIILYSREQIIKENEAMSNENDPEDDRIPWGIISVKSQDEDYELPMNPITVLRNALGREEGGSGVPLDREKYMQSVEYWSKHAIIQ